MIRSFSAPWLRLLAVALIAGTVCAPSTASRRRRHGHIASAAQARAASARKVEFRHRLHGVAIRARVVRSKIHGGRVRAASLQSTISGVQARIDATKARLRAVNIRLAVLATRHVALVRRISETEQRLKTRRRMLASRLRDTYQEGEVTGAQVMIQSRSVHDLLSRGVYVRHIVQTDTTLVHGIREDLSQVQRDRLALESETREQRGLADEFEARKNQLARDRAEEQALLQNVQQEVAESQSELDDLEAEAGEMSSRIRSLSDMLRQRQAAIEEEARRQARLRRRRGRRHTPIATPDDEPSPEVPHWNGQFMRPCAGRITSSFGYRYHPILHRRKMHSGVDFGASYGASIHAAGSGTVILAVYTRGYGNCVILDHGGGVTTLYGHCSELLVSEGQSVHQGQTIARVGATGLATGPHLHFEVRRDGEPVRPF